MTPPSKAVAPNTPVVELIPGTVEPEESLLHHYWHEAVAGGLFLSIATIVVAYINRDRIKRKFGRK